MVSKVDLRKRKAKDERIENLLIKFGNAMFDCGEYDNDDAKQWVEEYEELRDKADSAKNQLLDALGQ